LEIVAEKFDATARSNPRQIDIQIAETRNDRELLARTGDRHIQAPASTLGQKRTEAQRKIARSIFA